MYAASVRNYKSWFTIEFHWAELMSFIYFGIAYPPLSKEHVCFFDDLVVVLITVNKKAHQAEA